MLEEQSASWGSRNLLYERKASSATSSDQEQRWEQRYGAMCKEQKESSILLEGP